MEWQKKIYNHEENPPDDLWSRISGKLDEEPWAIRKNLSNYEVIPPVSLREKILDKLEPGYSGKKKAVAGIFTLKPVRIAVAVAVAGALLLLVYYFVNEPGIIKPSDIAANIIDSEKSKISSTEIPENPDKTRKPENGTEGNANRKEVQSSGSLPDPETVKEVNRSRYYPAQIARQYPKSFPATFDSRALTAKLRNSRGEIVSQNQAAYFTITDEHGQIIRVSPKLRNIIHYLQGTDTQTRNNRGQYVSEYDYWQNIFSQWKQKVGSAAYIPDGGNFFDILELVRIINENK